MARPVFVLLLTVMLGGCAATTGAERPARINHVVLFALVDPQEADELIADCGALAMIPGVESYAAGPPLDIGREEVMGDYEVGLLLGFDTEAAYRAYLDHPDHDALVQKWRPRVRGMRIYDVVDD
ncbi:MAG: Dabb family protein [Planctomycetota bacterium]|jgi:hypothetical protein